MLFQAQNYFKIDGYANEVCLYVLYIELDQVFIQGVPCPYC